MVDFDGFEKDTLKDTFKVLDDFNEEGFNWRDMRIFSQPADEYIENFFDRKKQRSRTDRILKSFPEFASLAAEIDADLGDDVFSFTKNKFRRSESSYSTTSGYETSSSNETISEEVNGRRRDSRQSATPSHSNFSSRCSTPKSKYSPSSSASSPFHPQNTPSSRARTYSQRNDSDLSKKLENKFMKDERHSAPHEIYSDCQHNPNDLERPHSVPVNSAGARNNRSCDGSESSLRFFPGGSMNSSRDSLCSEPLDRFISRLSSFSSGSSRSSSVIQDARNSSPKESPEMVNSNTENKTNLDSKSSHDIPDVLKGDPNGPRVRNIPIARPDEPNWSERQGRIEGALKWLRSELIGLRAQDKTLLSQLKRCHDTIEDLKKQRSQNEHSEGEDEEEEGHWEDWEIAEFEKRYAENPELAESLFNMKGKKSATVKKTLKPPFKDSINTCGGQSLAKN